MKKILAGILAVICVMGSFSMCASPNSKSGISTAVTAAAADAETPEPGLNAGSYKYQYADTSMYTTKFTEVKIYADPETKKQLYTWKSSDGKFTYGVYKVEVTPVGEKVAVSTEYVVGITKANENVIDVDLSKPVDKDDQVVAYLNSLSDVELSSWNVGYLNASSFADSYLKTIKLDGVKYIGANTFDSCKYITDIEIPASVLYVGTGAFSKSGLKTLSVQNEMPVIPASLCDNTKLTKIEFAHPELIRKIEKSAFMASAVAEPFFMSDNYGKNVDKYELLEVGESAYENCTQIKSVVLTDNVVSCGIGAFRGCASITTLKSGKKLLGYDQECFKNCTALNDITFNDILICLGGGCFQGCTSLKKVTGIPETLGDWVYTDKKARKGYGMGEGVFSNCTGLVQCDLPEELTKIPAKTFYACSALTTLGFNSGSGGANILTVCTSAFEKCTSLLEAGFANAVVLEPNAYNGCSKLIEAKFPKATVIGGTEDAEATARGVIADSDLDLENNAMKSGGSTFADCSALTTVEIPSSKYIFPNSFKKCTSLINFKAGKCEIVGNYAMDSCTAIKEITLLSKQYGNAAPTKSNKTNGYTFNNCSAAEKITIDAKFLVDFPNKTPNGFFNGCSSLKNIVTENGDFSEVTVVSYKTFTGCSSLEEMDLKSVIIVEDDAFSGCSSLKKISSSANSLHAEDYGKNAFLNCSELKFKITGTISTIGDYAFKNSGITAVDLEGMQGGTVVIGTGAFTGCENLVSAKILSDSAAKFSIGTAVFANCPILKDVTYEGKIITSKMFQNCPKLTTVTTNAKNIKEYAFDGDTQLRMLKDVSDPTRSVIADEINAYAFNNCEALEVIPANKDTVLKGAGIFTNCKTIKKADVGMLTASIFSGCQSLSDVKMTGISEIPNSAFANCASLKSIDIAEMTNIGTSAFAGSGLTSVKLNNAQLINTSAFAGCNSLKSIDVVATTIGSKAFNKCEFLTDADLNVDKVMSGAFDGCASLRNVNFQSSGSHELAELSGSAFNNCSVLYELILTGDPKMGVKSVGYVNNKVNGDFVLVGNTGSSVEEYANNYKIAFKDINDFDLNARKLARNVPGDIDGNTVVSIADAVKLQSWLLGKPTPGIIGSNMDLTGDKRVDSFDMIAMRNKLTSK